MQEKLHVHNSFLRPVDLGILNLNQKWKGALEKFFPLFPQCVSLSCQSNVKYKTNLLWCYAVIFLLACFPYYLIKCHQRFHCQTKTFVLYFLYLNGASEEVRNRNATRSTFFWTFYDCGLSVRNLIYCLPFSLYYALKDHQD